MADTIARLAASVTSQTGTTPSAASASPRPASPTRRRSRRTSTRSCNSAHHPVEEPEPARAARHQPVHPATGAVRRRRAADQHEPAAHLAGQLAEGHSGRRSAMSFLGSTATVDGATTKLASGAASWSFAVDKPSTATVNIKNSAGLLAYSGSYPLTPGTQNFNWDGRGNNGAKWPDGDYTLSVTAKDASGNIGRGLDRGEGHRRQRRPDAEPADAQDRRPELRPRQDQAVSSGRALAAPFRGDAHFSAPGSALGISVGRQFVSYLQSPCVS